MGKCVPDTFTIQKQDALSLLLFKFISEYGFRKVQANQASKYSENTNYACGHVSLTECMTECNGRIAKYLSKNVAKFKYLDTTLTNKNCMCEGINS
jgi:hypothetical protein